MHDTAPKTANLHIRLDARLRHHLTSAVTALRQAQNAGKPAPRIWPCTRSAVAREALRRGLARLLADLQGTPAGPDPPAPPQNVT